MKKVLFIVFLFSLIGNGNIYSQITEPENYDIDLSPDNNLFAGTYNIHLEDLIDAIFNGIDTLLPNIPVIYDLDKMEICSNFFEYQGKLSGILFFKHNWIEKSRFIIKVCKNDTDTYNVIYMIKTYEKSRPRHQTWLETCNSQTAKIYLSELVKIIDKKIKGDI